MPNRTYEADSRTEQDRAGDPARDHDPRVGSSSLSSGMAWQAQGEADEGSDSGRGVRPVDMHGRAYSGLLTPAGLPEREHAEAVASPLQAAASRCQITGNSGWSIGAPGSSGPPSSSSKGGLVRCGRGA